MPYEPIVPDGQHLGTSHDVDGAATGHLFEDGTNRLVGHAAWQWVDEAEAEPLYEESYRPEPPRELTPEEIEAAIVLAGVIVAGIVKAAAVAAPHVQRWWNSKLIPTCRAAWNRLTVRRKQPLASDTPSDFVEEAMFVASATGVELARTDGEIRMSSAEWEARFRSMLFAGAFAQEQMRVLSIARIDEQQAVLEKPSASETLTPQQFVERVKLMLEAHPELLSEETSAQLVKAFRPSSNSPELPNAH